MTEDEKRQADYDAVVENGIRGGVSDPLHDALVEFQAEPCLDEASKPWGIACGEFPVGMGFWDGACRVFHRNRATMSEHGLLSFTRWHSEQWHKRHGHVIEGDNVVPDKLSMHVPLLA